jgi:Helix-turn-helix of DDE superfamily endonuclease
MFYRNIKDYAPEKFRRLTGVSKSTFALMVDALVNGLRPFGRPPALCLEDRLLMVLMYWREYRTFEHIGETYGVSESTVCRTVKQFENVLIKDKRFHLPGKKALTQSETVFEIVLIDATECPCERPKKNSAATTVERRSGTP